MDRSTESRHGDVAKVLIVDDEPLVGRALARGLSRMSNVTVVTSVSDGIDLIAAGGCFDVILCDMLMPDGGRMGFYEAVSKLGPDWTAKIVFMTGGVFSQPAKSFLSRVDNRQLEKPVPLAELMRVVSKFHETE